MIFNPPASKKGNPRAGTASIDPVKTGATAAPAFRATDRMPADAARSSASTTAMV